MNDRPTYLVTARAANPLAKWIEGIEHPAPRRDLPRFVDRESTVRTPASYRREWFDYIRDTGDDLA